MHRRKSTRWLALVLSLVLIAAACADDGANPAEDGPGSSEDPPPSSAPAEVPGSQENAEQLTSEGEGSADPGEAEPQAGSEITWGLAADGTGFDTTGAISPGSIRIITALMDPLVSATIEGDWAPNLAESLTPNEDFTAWQITMRPDVRFHDGEPVDAAAMKANLDAFKGSPLLGFAFAAVDEIVVVDDLAVEVRMNRPWGSFPFSLIAQPGWLVSPSTIGSNDTFVGAGPFKLVNWTPNEGARVERNEDYWRDGLPYLDAINFRNIPEQAVRREGLEANNLSGYLSPGDADILDYLEDDNVDVWIGVASSNEHVFVLNTQVAPTDDVRVRRALAYALDRQLVIDTFRSGLTEPADGPFHPDSIWYADTDYPDYDPDEARRLIAEYEAEVGDVVLEISTTPVAASVEVVELVAELWREAGIDVTVKEIALGTSVTEMINDNYQVFNWVQFSATDPDGDYTFLHSTGGALNWSNLQNDKIDEGLDIGRANADYESRYEGYALFQEGMTEAMPMVWVDHLGGVESVVARPNLHGIGGGVLPDGQESIGMIAGSFFSWEDVWLEPDS